MPETPTTPRHDSPVHADRVIAGRYRLVRRIASGGMAEVWEAVDADLRRPVALKILHAHLASDRSFVTRFHAEALAIARLQHPSIVAVYDACSEGSLEIIVMELIQGRTLRDYLDDRGVLDPVEALRIGWDVASALIVAHRAGVIHRDIKPANILLSDDGRVLVTDFGIAKIEDATDVTSTGTMLGSVKYLAPEQVEGLPVDPRTDIYALGVVLYEAICGRPPFVAESPAATALARLRQDPPSPTLFRPDLSPSISALLLRCLARDRDRRLASASELVKAIDTARRDPPVPVDVDARRGRDPDATIVERSHRDLPEVPSDITSQNKPRARPPVIRVAPVMATMLILIALAVAGTLLWRARPTHEPTGETAPTDQIAADQPVRLGIAGITTFDPQGSGEPGENDDLAHFAVDGLIATSWQSESYATRSFGNLKSGVGLVIEVDDDGALARLDVRSPSRGWSGTVYSADTSPSDLDGWGPPVDSRSDIDGDAVFDLHGAKGRYLLLWITDLGDGPTPVAIRVAEMMPQR